MRVPIISIKGDSIMESILGPDYFGKLPDNEPLRTARVCGEAGGLSGSPYVPIRSSIRVLLQKLP